MSRIPTGSPDLDYHGYGSFACFVDGDGYVVRYGVNYDSCGRSSPVVGINDVAYYMNSDGSTSDEFWYGSYVTHSYGSLFFQVFLQRNN